MIDLAANIKVVESIAKPTANTADTNGASADREGFDAVAAVIRTGVITDGTHTFKLQESDDDAAWTDVAAADQDVYGNDGSLAIEADDDDLTVYVNYHGIKRYVRAVVTVAGETTGGIYRADFVLGAPHNRPVNS